MRRRLIGWVLIAALMALVSAWYRHHHAVEFCQFDNDRIEPVYEVDLIMQEDEPLRFCSVYCARQWQQRSSQKVESVIVRDEITGKPIDASLATFVKSEVVTGRTQGNRIHVFADPERAQRHAEQYHGKVIPSPFQTRDEGVPEVP